MASLTRLGLLKLRRQEGLSLVELAVYIVVLGLISTIMATSISSSFRAETVVADTTQVSNQTQLVNTLLGNDARNARSVNAKNPVTGALTPLANGSYTSITFEVARQTGALCWEPVTWAFVGDKLQRTTASGTASHIDIPISNGTFVVSGRTIEFSYDLASGGAAQKNASGSVVLGPAGQTGAQCS